MKDKTQELLAKHDEWDNIRYKRHLIKELLRDEYEALESARKRARDYLESEAARLNQALKNTEYYIATGYDLYKSSGDVFRPGKVKDILE